MRRAEYFDSLWVDADLLNYDASGSVDSLKERTKALLNSDAIPAGSGSIVGTPGDTSLQVTRPSAGNLSVAAGRAIDKNGELIYVPSDISSLEDEFAPARTAREDISLVSLGADADGLWYFGVEYLLASGCVKSNREGQSFATRYYDRYTFKASQAPFNSPTITLATFTTVTGEATNVVDTRETQRLSCQVNAANVYIIDTPVEAITTLEQHVNAVGDATPTSTNPHGQKVYPDFNDLTNKPSGLFGGLLHGVDAHDDTVPVSRYGTALTGDALTPVIDGGGDVWVDGYIVPSGSVSAVVVLDSNIDWRYRWINASGYIGDDNRGNEFYPGGDEEDSITGYLQPASSDASGLCQGVFYSFMGNNITDVKADTLPYLQLESSLDPSSKLRLYVNDTTGDLEAYVDYWHDGDTTNRVLSFGLCINYSPRRSTL